MFKTFNKWRLERQLATAAERRDAREHKKRSVASKLGKSNARTRLKHKQDVMTQRLMDGT